MAEGGQQWLKQFLQGGVVAVRAVGDAEHADHLAVVLQWQAQEAVKGRMPVRQAAAPRVLLWCVAQQRLATAQDLPEEGVKVAKFHADRCLLGIEAQGFLVPGNVADRVGFQVRLTDFVMQDFADKTKGAVGKFENALQEFLEGFAMVLFVDIGRQGLGHDSEQLGVLLLKWRPL